MASGRDVFRRNGYELSWHSSIAKVENDEFFGWTGVDYEEKLERAFARGFERGGPPRAMTRGTYSVDGGVLKGNKSSMIALLEKLASLSPDGLSYGFAPFFFSLQYIENDIAITEELYECRVSGRKVSLAHGADALVEEIPIMVMYAKLTTANKSGMTLFDNSRKRF